MSDPLKQSANVGVHQIVFPRLHAAQREIYNQIGKPHQYSNAGGRDILRCGRRFGKTVLLETRYARRAIAGRKVGWFTPDYKLMRPTFSRFSKALLPIISHSSKTEAIIELKSGGCIEFWTLDNEDAGRSRDYDDVVIDEASLVKKGLREIIEQAIAPTLLDRNGTLILAGTPKGIDSDNFFYLACTDKTLGYQEFHMPTARNPRLSREAIDALPSKYPPLVLQQEYMAEFVDWSGQAFFSLNSMLYDGQPVAPFTHCDMVFAVIDSATKTGKENDGTAVTYFALNQTSLTNYKLVVLDWDLVQIEGALLETWLPTVLQQCQIYAVRCGARHGSGGAFIEDKASGMILLQQAARRGLPARPIDSDLTAMGKSERAISVSGYVFQGLVKLSALAYEKTINYKGSTKNHLLNQVTGFRVGIKDQIEDDLLDTFCYGIAISLGDNKGH